MYTDTPFTVESRVDDEEQLLMDLYLETNRTVDSLAYTRDFDELYRKFSERYPDDKWDKAAVFRKLLMLRKAGLLPRLFNSLSTRPEPSSE